MVLVDGFAAGLWKITRPQKTTSLLTIQTFDPLPKKQRTAVVDEGAELLAWATPETTNHDIRFVDAE
jgi:hypothetical protein